MSDPEKPGNVDIRAGMNPEKQIGVPLRGPFSKGPSVFRGVPWSGVLLILLAALFLSLNVHAGSRATRRTGRSTSATRPSSPASQKPGQSNDSKKKGKGTDKAKETETEKDELFLPEGDKNQSYVPDIFRCPECGYEQDEPGTCPDHDEIQLVMVLSKGKNPLEMGELDGNEDLIVDMPVAGLSLKKAKPGATASGPESLGERKTGQPGQAGQPTPRSPEDR